MSESKAFIAQKSSQSNCCCEEKKTDTILSLSGDNKKKKETKQTELDNANNSCCAISDGCACNDQNDPECACKETETCCGPPPAPRSGPMEKPGYMLMHFTDGFIEHPAGTVPRIKTAWNLKDYQGALSVRTGLNRNNYKITPGLYAVGNPCADSPVLVSANYKLSFDMLRKELTSINAYILVLDTRGVNVWCAAGKGTFSTEEIILQVEKTNLSSYVNRRKLIVPQLAAPGVSAIMVKKICGFEVVWGPVRAEDLPRFLEHGAASGMREVTFSMKERAVLIPIEIYHLAKPFAAAVVLLFLFSGIGPGFFSFGAAFSRFSLALFTTMTGIFAGAILTPLFLQYLPGKAFSVKGAIAGILSAFVLLAAFRSRIVELEALAVIISTIGISSYLAMNFTGSSPYTSPSGVEKEMRRFIPYQIVSLIIGICLWVGSSFV